MKVNFKWFGYFLLSFLVFSNLDAQEDSIYTEEYYEFLVDTSIIEFRSFDSFELEKIKSQPEYNYDNDPDYDTSFWGTIRTMIGKFVEKNIGEGAMNSFWQIFNYSIAILGLIILLFALARMSGNPVFQKERKEPSINPEIIDENLSLNRLKELLSVSLQNHEFRSAIRIQHLMLLKDLEKKQLIDWQEYKTNADFMYELPNEGLKAQFKTLSWVYENAWYGEFPVDKILYDDYHDHLNEFKLAINKTAVI